MGNEVRAGAGNSRFPVLARYADQSARWCAIALGFSLPISVALDNLLLVVALVGWLASGAYRDKLSTIKQNAVCTAALVLLALLAIGTLHGEQSPRDAVFHFKKYIDLLYIPVFACLFRDATTRRHALLALAASLALVLALSLLLKLGVLPGDARIKGDAVSPTVFKLRLTHNILMAFGAFLFAWLAVTEANARLRFTWAALAALAVINVTMMVQGATGYLILGGLILLFGHGLGRWRGFGIALAAVTLAAIMLASLPGPFKERVGMIGQELQGWQARQPQSTSVGLRLEFYRNTLGIIRDHPLIGVGTGGFSQAYASRVRGTGMTETRNPHNEFLHIAAQLGAIGVAALLWLFWQQWRFASRLASPFECALARGLVVTMVIGCMYNSLLIDHTEGLLFAWLSGVLYGGLKSNNE